MFQFAQCDDRILDIFGGAQHRLPIRSQILRMLSFGLRHFGIHAAEIEQTPMQTKRRLRLERA